MTDGDLIFKETWMGASTGENAWTSEVTGAGVWFPNFDCTSIGSPKFWGPRCLWSDHSAGEQAYGGINLPNVRDTRTAVFEFIVSQESLADNGIANIMSFKQNGLPTVGSNELIARFQFMQVSSSYFLAGFVRFDGTDGTSNVMTVPSIQLNQIYRIEFEWDLVNNLYTVWLDGVPQAIGAITGLPMSDPWYCNTLQPGGTVIDTAAATHFMGPLIIYQGHRVPDMWDKILGPAVWGRKIDTHSATVLTRKPQARKAELLKGSTRFTRP